MGEEAGVQRATIPITVLVVEDDESTRKLCADVVESSGMKAIVTSTVEEALLRLETHAVDIIVTDLILPPSSGLELLKQVHEMYPQVAVVVMTHSGTIDSAVAATRMGAVDYVSKPFHIEDLRARLDRVARGMDLDRENRLLREQLRSKPGFGGMIGVSAKMQRVYKMIEKVSQHEYPVLILGESGTGKELVARSIHYSGIRKERPFAQVDCASLVPLPTESELFGYVEGAFSGATQSQQGLLEAARGGTLFLDEIGDMPVDLQAKFLRAFEEREVKPVGSTERRRINIRIIAATNKDLKECVRKGTFREDLYYRLDVISVTIPPLRERVHDLENLAGEFLHFFARQFGRNGLAFSESALRKLRAHSWRGNIRELRNTIERSAILAQTDEIGEEFLPEEAMNGEPVEATVGSAITLDQLEEVHIRSILQKSTSLDSAARTLGIDPATLYRKRKRLKL